MLDKLIGGTIAKIVGPEAGTKVVEYFDNKQALKQQLALAKLQGKIDAQVAKNALASAQAQQGHEWSMAQIANSGWKDEYVLLVLSVPLVLVFCPWTQPAVLDGFIALGETPEWYRWLLVSVMAAIYGIKPAVNIWRKKSGE